MAAPGSGLRIRHARPGDAGELARLAARTFRDTFAGQNEPADMEAYVERWFSEEQLGAELASPESSFLLALGADGRPPIGYAKLRTGEPDPSVRGEAPVEIERLYVDRGALGRGVGAALMRACLEEAAERGYRTIWLGVWERNERAIDFYRRWGFAEVGAHLFQLGSDPQKDLVLERAVADSG